MRLNRNHYLVLISVGVIILYFTYSGYKSSGIDSSDKSQTVSKAVDISSLVDAEKNKLPEAEKKRAAGMEQDKSALKKLVVFWDSLGKQLPAAFYMWKLAEQQPDEKNWFLAGSKYYNAAMMSSDTNIYMEAGKLSKSAFEKALEMNPENLDAKNALASCYVDIDHDIMKGVGLLKQVIQTDSNNIQALFTLGMLSMQSGQLEKAKVRFEKLISLQPFNAEFYYYLGEVYAKLGEKEKAVQTYGKCKTLITDKAAQKEIESLINKLKTI